MTEPKPGSPTAKDFRLPSGMPLDAGRDQMGNIRDIARGDQDTLDSWSAAIFKEIGGTILFV